MGTEQKVAVITGASPGMAPPGQGLSRPQLPVVAAARSMKPSNDGGVAQRRRDIADPRTAERMIG